MVVLKSTKFSLRLFNHKNVDMIVCRGEKAIFKANFVRGRKLSLLLCGGCNGVVCYNLIWGSCNEKYFLEFVVEKLFNHLHEYPQNQSILLLDNCCFHHSQIFKEMINQIGAIAIYISPYSPWLNMVEYMFNAIKSIEKTKQITGDEGAYLSVVDSVESIGQSWLHILQQIGYV